MHSLAIFPVEILEWITSVLPAWVVCRLCLTGDRTLAAKLGNGGVSTLVLDWDSSAWYPWPAPFLRSFKALHTIHWNSELSIAYCPALDLSLLPSTLTSLDICSEDVYCHMRAKKWKLDQLLPVLTTLELSGQRLAAENLKNLPPNLNSLVVAAHGEYIDELNILQQLPRGLEVLELWFRLTDDQEEGNELPSNLRCLTISEVEANFDWFKKIPRSVTNLSVSPKAPIAWESLPSGLLEMSLEYPSEIPRNALSRLPSGLTSLSTWVEHRLKDSDMANLPRSLKVFQDYTGQITHEGLQQAPPYLSDMSVNVAVTHPDIISLFHPDSIDMRLIADPKASKKAKPILLNPLPFPTKLDSLSVHYMTDPICQILPPELGSLDILGGCITKNGAKIFPTLKLRNASISIEALDNDCIPYLKHICRLSFSAGSKLTRPMIRLSSDFLQLLVSSSVSSDLVPITSASIMQSGHLGAGTNPIVQYIPPSMLPLNYLNFSFADFESAPEFLPKELFTEWLSHLPHLDSLHITAHKHNIKPSWLHNLPRTLKHLEISVLSTFPKAEHLASLPTGLHSLELEIRTGKRHETYTTAGSCPWTDQDLASLPKCLQTLRINAKLPNLTPALNQFTPPYLAEFRISWSDFKLFENPLTRAYGPDTTTGSPDYSDDASDIIDALSSDTSSINSDPSDDDHHASPFDFTAGSIASAVRNQLKQM